MSPSDIRIRAQEPEDVRDLTELWRQPQVVWGTLQLPFVSVEARRVRAAASPPGLHRLVAEVEGKVAGAVSLQCFENRRAHMGSIGMAVHDAYAGRGIGSALMAAVVDLSDRWLGLKRLELRVWADNHAAIGLYEKFGFEREGLLRAEGFRDGAYVDAFSMARIRGI
jgi:putative acetyltransferase